MSPVHLRNQPEDREGLSRNRRPGGQHLGHSGGLQDIEGNNTHSAIHISIQQKPQNRGLEGYGSSSSAPPTPQRPFSMEHGPQELSSSFKPSRNQQISGQQSPFFTISGIFHEKTRIQGQKQDLFQPKAERVRGNDPEAVGLGERSTQEPGIVLHTSTISSPFNRNIIPTQIEPNVVTPESNLVSNSLWLKIPQFAEKTEKQFAELQSTHERMKTLTVSMEKSVKTLQDGHSQLSKASEETHNRRDQLKDNPRERVAEVTKKKSFFHNCGSTDHCANNCPKAKKKVYAIENVKEEESPTEDSESDSMGDAIRATPKRGVSSEVPRGNTTRNSGHTVRSRHPTRNCKQKLV
ncbi:hypothetical protein O181_066928 [Austropuccinia psidii MF-1]|uniref:Uncharacterized protein n=1 Tax=Austropuccinia psidii MF-1 TaxID=1389203 RepID=A0A9Q3I420_9BASI|nr:hypothetical protein [Austropuccinia psidii MF-1]